MWLVQAYTGSWKFTSDEEMVTFLKRHPGCSVIWLSKGVATLKQIRKSDPDLEDDFDQWLSETLECTFETVVEFLDCHGWALAPKGK